MKTKPGSARREKEDEPSPLLTVQQKINAVNDKNGVRKSMERVESIPDLTIDPETKEHLITIQDDEVRVDQEESAGPPP